MCTAPVYQSLIKSKLQLKHETRKNTPLLVEFITKIRSMGNVCKMKTILRIEPSIKVTMKLH